MELEPIGHIENPQTEPIIVPIVAYTHDGKERVEKFPFKAVMPAGAMSAMLRNAGVNGEVPFAVLLLCLQRCVMPDAAERFTEFLDSDELNVHKDTLGKVFEALVEVYSDRPTQQRSGSRSGGQPARRTSRAAARSAASRSKTKPSS